jgi:hypothetical protein
VPSRDENSALGSLAVRVVASPLAIVIAIVAASCSDRPDAPWVPGTDRSFACTAPKPCTPFACELATCKESCASKSDCAPGFKCDRGPCIPASPCAPGFTGPGGIKFSDLYRDVFADTDEAAGRCQNGLCHGGSLSPGLLSMGSTKHDVYVGLTTHRTVNFVAFVPACGDPTPPACCDKNGEGCPVVVPGPNAFASSALPVVIRPNAVGAAYMPKITASLGNCTLPADVRARIDDWLKAGAPEN